MGSRAFGTRLRYTPLSGAAITIGEVTGFGGPELAADSIDLVAHDATSRYREFVQGLRDGGEITIEGNHVPGDAGQAAVLAHFDAATAAAERPRMELYFPDASSWQIVAMCTRYKAADSPHEGKLGFSASFKLTGKPAFGASQAAGLTTTFFALSEGDGTVAPSKASATYAYTAEVANGISSLTITPVSAAGDTIYVEAEELNSAEESSAISLSVGANTLTVVVEQDGLTYARYEIVVTRAAE